MDEAYMTGIKDTEPWMIEKARQHSSDDLKSWIWSEVSGGSPVPMCLSVESLRIVLRERGEDGKGWHNT